MGGPPIRTRPARLRVLAPLLLAGCTASAPPPVLDDAATPEMLMAGLEERMLREPEWGATFAVRSEGAFAAALDGVLTFEGARTAVRAEGTFGGAPVALDLVSDGVTMSGGSADRRLEAAEPAALREALVMGFTRMGILHNLARLTGGHAPDHAAGGAGDWVRLRDVRRVDAAEGEVALRFEVEVAGAPAGEATLWLDRASGRPLRREQTVRFTGGSMQVTETYAALPAGAGTR
jgi:hypothetical protein